MENKARPAFPIPQKDDSYGNFDGLSKREYFAGVALQGWLSCDRSKFGYDYDSKSVARKVVELADCILKELNK